MDKKIGYNIVPELSIMIEYLCGKVDGDDAINLKKMETMDPKFNPNYNCLVDFRDTEITMNKEGLKSMSKFIDFFKGEQAVLSNRKSALLTSGPQQVVLSSLLKQMSIELPISFEIFSTLESSVAFINGSSRSLQRIDDELFKLK